MKNKQEKRNPIGYWDDIGNCKKEALKYKSKSEFCSKSRIAYNNLRINNLLDDIFGKKYTKELCHQEALKFLYKRDFRKKSLLIYTASIRNGWFEEITSHMKNIGNDFYKLVYVYEFTDNHVYIGLTYDEEKRYNEHMNDTRSAVYKHLIKSSLTPKYFTVSDYISTEDAQELEHTTRLNYLNNNWIVLNTAKTGKGIGSVGGNNLKWTLEACKKEASKHKKYKDFVFYSKGAYNSAKCNKWLSEIKDQIKKQNL
ncbi:MAG: Vibrio phage [Bacteroidota bacterium]